MGKIVANNELGRIRTVGVDPHLVRIGSQFERRGPTLYASKIIVRLVVDAPHFIRD